MNKNSGRCPYAKVMKAGYMVFCEREEGHRGRHKGMRFDYSLPLRPGRESRRKFYTWMKSTHKAYGVWIGRYYHFETKALGK